LTVGELAKRSGVAVSALHYYEARHSTAAPRHRIFLHPNYLGALQC
jgi:DNA-binding transcriptional MerR regulator